MRFRSSLERHLVHAGAAGSTVSFGAWLVQPSRPSANDFLSVIPKSNNSFRRRARIGSLQPSNASWHFIFLASSSRLGRVPLARKRQFPARSMLCAPNIAKFLTNFCRTTDRRGQYSELQLHETCLREFVHGPVKTDLPPKYSNRTAKPPDVRGARLARRQESGGPGLAATAWTRARRAFETRTSSGRRRSPQ
jgi:hypothetical protein